MGGNWQSALPADEVSLCLHGSIATASAARTAAPIAPQGRPLPRQANPAATGSAVTATPNGNRHYYSEAVKTQAVAVYKDGTSKCRQVYHCGDCGRRTIPDTAYQRPSAADKERALPDVPGE